MSQNGRFCFHTIQHCIATHFNSNRCVEKCKFEAVCVKHFINKLPELSGYLKNNLRDSLAKKFFFPNFHQNAFTISIEHTGTCIFTRQKRGSPYC
jgi:hypothetical protein